MAIKYDGPIQALFSEIIELAERMGAEVDLEYRITPDGEEVLEIRTNRPEVRM